MAAVGGSGAGGLAPSGKTYAGLFMVALATLTYEILLTRIFSVTTLYHFAFAAISVAMFGMTLGAVIVHQAPGWFTPARTRTHVATSALLFALTSVAAFVGHVLLPFLSGGAWQGFAALAPTYVLVSVPFTFSGICVCLTLTRATRGIGRLYASDLMGAALGCVALIGTLKITDGPTAVLVVAFLGAVGSAILARDGAGRRLRRVTLACAVALGLAAALHTALVWRQSPLLRLYWVKGHQLAGDSYLYEKWNSFSRITVEGDPRGFNPPSGWGLSPFYNNGRLIHELQLFIDSTAGTRLVGYTGGRAELDHLKHDIVNLAHYLRPHADVLVIGSGGGRDLLSAIAFDQASVIGVEINEEIIDAVNRRFGDFTGHLDRDPRITFVNDEARSYVARQQRRFDIIQVSLIDTWAATAAGGLVLTENSLYTVEAWKLFLDHLKPGGVLTVTRWYLKDRPIEIYRLTALASTALRRAGVADPRGHILLARRMRPEKGPSTPDGVGTMLISRDPFSTQDLETLEAVTGRMGFEVVLTPTLSRDDLLWRLTGADTFEAVIAAYPLNIAAPTDDSPFFFHMLRLKDIFNDALRREWEMGANASQIKAVSVLGTLLLVVTALTLIFILGPLALAGDRRALKGSSLLIVYFAGIGTGFMLVEISQLQRLVVFLGHPTYALSVVLFSLLLASGMGSLLSDRIGARRFRAASRAALGALLAALALFGLLTPRAADALAGAATPVRILTAGGILWCIGLLMGMPFPLGMRLAGSRSSAITPWLWGINGAASVFASVLGVAIALTAGISAAFWIGFGCYGVSVASFLWMDR